VIKLSGLAIFITEAVAISLMSAPAVKRQPSTSEIRNNRDSTSKSLVGACDDDHSHCLIVVQDMAGLHQLLNELGVAMSKFITGVNVLPVDRAHSGPLGGELLQAQPLPP